MAQGPGTYLRAESSSAIRSTVVDSSSVQCMQSRPAQDFATLLRSGDTEDDIAAIQLLESHRLALTRETVYMILKAIECQCLHIQYLSS